ncbi:MAG TPA: prolyl oligopeptidase family serine peptidase, partial [Terriglobales bacterium]
YLVLEPDIVYDSGDPGDSALKCVLPAIAAVQAMGFVDPHRIGIQGHSWGGYEVAYMITRTDKFRAVEAGAVVADMISAYGGIRWGTGISRESQYEHGQSRIGASLWQDPLDYITNSPLFRADRVHTPYLTIHNDADDAVPWYQGIEFYLALRRLHKPAWMFSFHGEKHHLLQRENQKYYTVHMDEFFDHYLLNAPEPPWMKAGVPYLQRGQRDVDALFRH